MCQAALLKLVEDVRKDFAAPLAAPLGALFAGATDDEVTADRTARRKRAS